MGKDPRRIQIEGARDNESNEAETSYQSGGIAKNYCRHQETLETPAGGEREIREAGEKKGSVTTTTAQFGPAPLAVLLSP
jgi:hypothetical protein